MSRKQSEGLTIIMLLFCLSLTQGVTTLPSKAVTQPQFIHDYGNWTYISKPGLPVKINAGSISIGNNHTYICNLKAGAKYHIYFYGDWVDYDPLTNKTDYDIFVYDPTGREVSMHTESAGLPEHLGTTVYDPFFIPETSGNYSFVIRNDDKESRGAKAGTFMIIEHLECNRWYEIFISRKPGEEPFEDAYWTYEFATSSERIEVLVEVPDPPEAYLDMYEAQLYLMANPSQGVGTMLNGMPLPWELGLYGEMHDSGIYGGYRLDAEGFRHVNASASCEYYGQDMLIDYVLPSAAAGTGNETSSDANRLFLYHLALIAENGEGVIRFMFKTDFTPPSLSIENPIESAYSDQEVDVTAHAYDGESGLKSVLLNYTTTDWENWTAVEMSLSENDTYVAKIPTQSPGSTVKYRVTASDMAGNMVQQENSYVVKSKTDMSIALSKTVLDSGESIGVNGWISHGSVTVTLDYTWQNTHFLRTVLADSDGHFTDEFTPDKAGTWTVTAKWSGNQECFPGSSNTVKFTVEKVSTSVTCSVNKATMVTGETVDVTGYVLPAERNMKVILRFTKPDGTTIERETYTSSDGSYELIAFKPGVVGRWQVQATVSEDEAHQSSSSSKVNFVVNETWLNQYKLYIIGAAVAAIIVVSIVILLSRKKEEIEEEE